MPKLVLIVEDSPHVAANVEIAASSIDGVETVCASSGEDAVRLLESRPIDAVVSDLDMPRMDGYELLAAVKTRWAYLPVIVCSASTDPGARQRVLDAGAHAFFSKPYSAAQLRETLERLLK